MSVLHVTEESFDEEVLQAKKTVIADFWASWCGPCRMLAPELEALAAEHEEIDVAKINVDDNPGLASRYGIMSIPTVMVFKNGELTETSVGYQTKEQLLSLL